MVMGKKMEEVSKPKEDAKLSYEELERVAANLNQQCNSLYRQLKETQAALADINEIGVLLSIIDKSEHFDAAFIDRCASKIQTVVTEALDAQKQKSNEDEK